MFEWCELSNTMMVSTALGTIIAGYNYRHHKDDPFRCIFRMNMKARVLENSGYNVPRNYVV